MHILAGWAVPSHALPAYQNALTHVKAKRPQATELHGVDIIKSPSGQRLIADFIAASLAAGCEPVWTAAEKRYCVAARIVETFLDPFYNPYAGWLPTGANDDRQQIAEIFCTLPTPLLKEFLVAYRTPTVEGLSRAAESLRNALRLMRAKWLSRSIDGAILHMEEIVDGEKRAQFKGGHFVGISLNFPVFVQFMTHADRLLHERGATGVKIVHDETSEFEGAFKDVFETFTNIKEPKSFTLQSGTEVYFGLNTLEDFRTGKSVQEIEIQGADLLASALRIIFTNLMRDTPMTEQVTRMARSIFGKTAKSKVGNFWLMGSRTLWQRFAKVYQDGETTVGAA